MAGGGGSTESGEPEFQIAPMIDVLLVLLIFFMSITTSQVLRIDKSIQLPLAKDAKKKDDKNAMNEGALNVRWEIGKQESVLNFQERTYATPEDLVARLTTLKNNNPRYRVVIRGDRRLPAIEIQKVMNIIAQAGIDDISFSALNQ